MQIGPVLIKPHGFPSICSGWPRGRNRTDFVLDAARSAAEEALLDQTLISVSPEAYARFLARLDMPPQPNER